MKTLVWIIGANGLVGSGVKKGISSRDNFILFPSPALNWGDKSELIKQFHQISDSFFLYAKQNSLKWSICWTAGSSKIGSSKLETDYELESLSHLLEIVQLNANRNQISMNGVVFFASSAGALYSGNTEPPFTESTEPTPTSAYGYLKMRMEAQLHSFFEKTQIRIVLGRITNVYGPGQSLSKSQGIVSELLKSQFYPSNTTQIFVPLETRRDFVYINDCGNIILSSVERALELAPAIHTKIVSSGTHATIADIIGFVTRITKKKINAIYSQKDETSLHSLDLRVKTIVWPDISDFQKTPLPAGISACRQDVLNQIQGQNIYFGTFT